MPTQIKVTVENTTMDTNTDNQDVIPQGNNTSHTNAKKQNHTDINQEEDGKTVEKECLLKHYLPSAHDFVSEICVRLCEPFLDDSFKFLESVVVGDFASLSFFLEENCSQKLKTLLCDKDGDPVSTFKISFSHFVEGMTLSKPAEEVIDAVITCFNGVF